MANEQQLAYLERGVSYWNNWRVQNPQIEPDLNGAELMRMDLAGYNLSEANLFEAYLLEANLTNGDLSGANLTGADLSRCKMTSASLGQAILNDCLLVDADLSGAVLDDADLSDADLRRALFAGATLANADLSGVNLCGAIFTNTNLDGACLKSAKLNETVFRNCSLRGSKQLQFCEHYGPSSIDHRSITQSRTIPHNFLQGCGLPEALIGYYRSTAGVDLNTSATYVSYVETDEDFARKLFQDLQEQGIRCWLENLHRAAKERRVFGQDSVNRAKERSIIILSKSSLIDRQFKEELQTMALAERSRQTKIIVPIRIDSATEKSPANWVEFLRTSRGIVDFSQWDYEEAYRSAFETLLFQLLSLHKTA